MSEQPQEEMLDISDLKQKDIAELRSLAERFNINGRGRIKKEDLIFAILKAQAEKKGLHFKDGVLEILPEGGFGFLRDKSCLPGAHDIYVSPSQIKRFGLKDGDIVSGVVRPPKDDEKYCALLKVEAINFEDPEVVRNRVAFEDLIPYHPNKQLKLEHDPDELSTRIIDLFAPIGKGQRGLIVSPPKAGKTTLLKHIAHGIIANHPEVYLIVLLVDERPEEVTDFRESISSGEVVAATFDQKPEIHCKISELVIAKAKRLVEMGRDVVILMDSITRLARAYNLAISPSGKLLSGGMDPTALYKPKEFFGAARNIKDGGSLTIIGTALVDTGSRLDQVVFEEFKGTGNMELVLERELANKRIFPAIDLEASGTRKEELLLPEKTLKRVWVLRKLIGDMNDKQKALEWIISRMMQTKTNEQFLELMRNE
ncbi:MAG: transcription termination factor Rho [Candidatus Bipolaricaulota bacterium]|nr:transcription termination factor Rho [Candidatus Bipolaricaulota bacterium]MCS7274308.1 transcription termination factor Rho [Candidatus Bipolaricaulota bacterium]MDW8111441.1 transcription termination factor Rho [Candidatus Bipolaricaulota bacterium]MDW8329738.1 transcription termination factor Rho [Candidatus Bipolaricaulota bacterium]